MVGITYNVVHHQPSTLFIYLFILVVNLITIIIDDE